MSLACVVETFSTAEFNGVVDLGPPCLMIVFIRQLIKVEDNTSSSFKIDNFPLGQRVLG